jgi:hypothetical protein
VVVIAAVLKLAVDFAPLFDEFHGQIEGDRDGFPIRLFPEGFAVQRHDLIGHRPIECLLDFAVGGDRLGHFHASKHRQRCSFRFNGDEGGLFHGFRGDGRHYS